jgi:hypothetical protein
VRADGHHAREIFQQEVVCAKMRQGHSAPASLCGQVRRCWQGQRVALSLAGGALKENQAFCAHPKFDADTGRMVAFSLGLRFAEGGRGRTCNVAKL